MSMCVLNYKDLCDFFFYSFTTFSPYNCFHMAPFVSTFSIVLCENLPFNFRHTLVKSLKTYKRLGKAQHDKIIFVITLKNKIHALDNTFYLSWTLSFSCVYKQNGTN